MQMKGGKMQSEKTLCTKQMTLWMCEVMNYLMKTRQIPTSVCRKELLRFQEAVNEANEEKLLKILSNAELYVEDNSYLMEQAKTIRRMNQWQN